MTITLSSDFSDRNIKVQLGFIEADVKVAPATDTLIRQMEEATDKRLEEFAGQPASSDPHIAATRKAYKALGKDPARYRPAAEALTRRILQGKGLYQVNNVVDINNLISISTGISIGTYLSDKIDGDILFRRAQAGEGYVGIGRAELNLEGLPVFCDKQGPFGCPTSDSERTMITMGNHKIIMVLIDFAMDSDLNNRLNTAQTLLETYADGKNFRINLVHNNSDIV